MKQNKMNINTIPIFIVLFTILLDILSGILKGGATGTLSSKVMREGIWRKGSEVLLAILGLSCTISYNLWDALPSVLDSVYYGICIYLIFMEIVSILENICEINPDLKIAEILKIFGINNDKK